MFGGRHWSRSGTVMIMEDAEDSSHLTRRQRYSYAAGAVGVWGPLVAFSAMRTTIYVIYLGAVRVDAAVCICVAFTCMCTCERMRMHARAHAHAHACTLCACTRVHTASRRPPSEVHVHVPCERRTRRRSGRSASSWAGGTRSTAPSSRAGPTPECSTVTCLGLPAGAAAHRGCFWARRCSWLGR